MKKILFIALILAALGAQSQITLEPDMIRVNVANEWKYVKHINYLDQAVNVPALQDTAIYTYYNFPLRMERIVSFKKIVGDTLYDFTNRSKVVQTYGGRLVLYQYVRKSVLKAQEKSDDMKLWFYTKKAKELGYNNRQFFNYPAVQELIVPPIITDTIQ